VVNIGGISNVTFLPGGKGISGVLAFDAGPGNMVLDGIMSHWSLGRVRMDRGGRLAQKGRVEESLLRQLIRHPFLKRHPPKSTGREAFGLPLLESLLKKSQALRLSRADVLATATAFTVYAIASSLRWLPQRGRDLHEVIVGGGGVRNKTLMAMLRGVLVPIPVLTYEDFGLDSRAIEAMAFALFAYTTYKGVPNNTPSATGARRRVAMGKIVTVGSYH
jgi:anhydro-N-acetylmuramic acid kinase